MTRRFGSVVRRILPLVALAALVASALLIRGEAQGAPTCDTHYTRDFFHVCFFSGTDPDTGAFLGTEDEVNLGSPAPDRTYAINRDFGLGPVFGGVSDNISGVWRGKVFFSGGRYQLTVFADDGVRLYVDSDVTPVINKWEVQGQNQAVPDQAYVIALELARGYHNVRVDWFESIETASLRLHWDKVPTIAGAVGSTVIIDAFIVTRQDVCIAGDPPSGGQEFKIYNPDGSLYRSWDANGLLILPRSDPNPEKECFSFGFRPDEITYVRDELAEFAGNIENWTFGALRPLLRITPLPQGDVLPTLLGGGLYLTSENIGARAKQYVSSDTDFAFAFTSVHELDDGIADGVDDGRYHDVPQVEGGSLCGRTSFGPGRGQGGLWGAEFTWVANTGEPGPDFGQCLTDSVITHEWGHQMRDVLESIMGLQERYPPYPPCGAHDGDTFSWFPDSHEWNQDPDSPWCSGALPVTNRGITAHQLLHHFDSSLAHYSLGFFTGNHCNNGRLDYHWEETDVDSGAGICPGLPPNGSISAPIDGTVVTGNYRVQVAADPYDAAYVEISVDGQLVKTDATSPYDYDWDTRQYPEGAAPTVSARAVDWAGMSSTAAATVTVTNVDTDGDSFLDGYERYMGTNPNSACPATTTGDDEPVDAWPPDFNDDTFVDITDISMIASHRLGARRGDSDYDPRYDLSADGFFDITDVSAAASHNGDSCS